jgi:hypothetical protein
MVLVDKPKPEEPVIYLRGNSGRPGARVPRQFLSILSAGTPKPFTHGSGRKELAEAIANPNNPLTARVFVNRVWGWLMGSPLVDTPSDFGVRTPPPSNPELLDYLAARFQQDGWSIKKLIRTLVLSRTYTQQSLAREDMEAKDPENRFYWRKNRVRMDFEAMRDSLLVTSGAANLEMFGRAEEMFDPALLAARRSIYGFIDRQNLPGQLRTFDFASPDAHSPKRFVTTVPQQALFMLNSPFMDHVAQKLVENTQATTEEEKLRGLFRRALGREPLADELSSAAAFLERANKVSTDWDFGYGGFTPESGVRFTEFPSQDKNKMWSGGGTLPDAQLGYANVHPGGGHPGRPEIATLLRWKSPYAGAADIKSALHLPSTESSGVVASIISSRQGLLVRVEVKGGEKQEVRVRQLTLEAGETLYFMVHCGQSDSHDSYSWNPVVCRPDKSVIAEARLGFQQPQPRGLRNLAQALLCSNEFIFVD